MKSGSTILRKPNTSLVMIPKAGKLTGIERKLFNSILLSSARQLKEYRSLFGREPSFTHYYCAHADELLDPIETGKSNLKSKLRDHIVALRKTEIDWQAPDSKSGIVWTNLSVLSEVKFEIRNGGLYVLWALPPQLNDSLSNFEEFPFTKIDLEQIALLKSYSSVALYEICARYRNNFLRGGDGECLTCVNPPEWWIDALVNIVPALDEQTHQPMRREWRKIKNETVNKAIEEINAVTDLVIELRERKEGKAVCQVQFAVRTKKSEPQQIQNSHFELIAIGLRLGLRKIHIESAIDKRSVEQVTLGLAKLEARLQQSELDPVKNVNQYFNTLLYEIAPVTVVNDASVQREPVSAAIKAAEEVKPVISPQTLAKEAFMLISEVEKKKFAVKAIEELTAKGVVTPRIRRNAEAGVWNSVLLSQMVEIFGRETQNP